MLVNNYKTELAAKRARTSYAKKNNLDPESLTIEPITKGENKGWFALKAGKVKTTGPVSKAERLHKSQIEKPVQAVWNVCTDIMDKHPDRTQKENRKAITQQCDEMGIAYHTVRTQVGAFFKTLNGQN